MEKLFFQFFVFFFFWLINAKTKKSYMTPSSWLLAIYMMGALCGVGDLYVNEYKMPYTPAFWEPMLVFMFTLLLFLLPFLTFNENCIKEIILPHKKILDTSSTIIIVLSFFAIFYFISIVVRIFSMGDLGYLRDSRYGPQGEEFVEAGMMNTIASVSASLYVFAILLFFIYSCIGGNKKRRLLLLAGSISEPLHIMAYVGRDGVVFWIFSFVFLFLLFRPYMPDISVKSIKKTFVVAAIALLAPFLAITLSRFESSDMGTGGSIISYMGQEFVNGPFYFAIDNPPRHPWGVFPLFRELFGLKEPVSSGMITIGEWRSWGFGTFLVSFVSNFGYLGTYLLSIILILFFYITIGKRKKQLGFHNIIIYILFFQVYSQGIFYFKQYTRGGNLFIVLCFVFAIIFRILIKMKKPIVISRIRGG